MKRYKMVCKDCKSENITVYTSTYWNRDSQQWDAGQPNLAIGLDYCRDCDATTSVEEVELKKIKLNKHDKERRK